jgi:hypothetical protein
MLLSIAMFIAHGHNASVEWMTHSLRTRDERNPQCPHESQPLDPAAAVRFCSNRRRRSQKEN